MRFSVVVVVFFFASLFLSPFCCLKHGFSVKPGGERPYSSGSGTWTGKSLSPCTANLLSERQIKHWANKALSALIWGNALNFAEPNLTLLQGVRRNMELTSRRFNWKDKKWLFWGSGPGARERQSKELQFSIMSFSNNRLKMKLLLLCTEIEHQQFHIVQSNRFLSN